MEAHFDNSAEAIKRLQLCLNDLVSILALPAVWCGGGPTQVVDTLLDTLRRMLRLDLVYVRLKGQAGGTPIEVTRTDPSQREMPAPHDVWKALKSQQEKHAQKWPALVREPLGAGKISILAVPLGLQGEIGVIAAGSQRADFPQETEKLLLSVAANQAAIGLQDAWLLNEQKHVSTELDSRVAQRTAELAAANEELQLQVALLQQIPVAAWTLDPDGTPDFVNQKWLDYTGQTLDYVQSGPESWMTAIHPDDRETVSRGLWEGIRSGQGFTMEARFFRVRDGTYRWHLNRAVALRDTEGRILRFVGTSTDIEDLKRAEQRLRESELTLRRMTETIPEMLWSAAPDGAIDYCNTRVLDYTGVPVEEIRAGGWIKLLHPGDAGHVIPVWRACVASGAPYRVEARIFHASDRAYRLCVTSALPLLDQQGRILGWHGTIVDLHDWKKAEEELRNTQAELAHMTRVLAMGELTASIAHEVNQPLAGIITNAGTCLRMLAANPPNIDGARETARRTIRDGNRASEVITRLRGLFSKKQAAAESVDLNEAAREVIALSMSSLQRNGVILRPELADGLPPVTGDRVQLQQVILNLVLNASEAMSEVDDRPRQLLIRTERDETDRVRLAVRDCGVGFEKQDADKLFKAFYTTKKSGIGIGLSLSRSIIENHRGRLWATPNDGPGATFLFSLPLTTQSPADAPAVGAARSS